MRIKKVLNSSVVLVEDDAHQESILLGKGIGFGQKPGNVIVENQENQVFLPVDNARSRQILELVNSLPPVMLELAQEIVLDAQQRLNTPLGENLVFILADHLNFALERIRRNLKLENVRLSWSDNSSMWSCRNRKRPISHFIWPMLRREAIRIMTPPAMLS